MYFSFLSLLWCLCSQQVINLSFSEHVSFQGTFWVEGIQIEKIDMLLMYFCG